MISCDKAAHLCNKSQYKEATFIEKLQLKFHLLICKVCSVHSAKNSKLTSLCKQAKLHSLSKKDKAEMKKLIDKNIT